MKDFLSFFSRGMAPRNNYVFRMKKNPKANDQSFKRLIEAEARDLLEALGAIEPGELVDVRPLDREIVMPSPSVDANLLVESLERRGERRIVVIEALSNADAGAPERTAWYAVYLMAHYQVPVYPYLLPLVERAYPKRPPAEVTIRRGKVGVRVGLTWWRPWEMDAGVLMAKGRPALDVWTVLCRRTDEQEAEVARRLMEYPELASRHRIWAGMRYRDDKEAFAGFLERIERVITQESDLESLYVQDLLARGRAEGMEKGLEKGLEKGMAKTRVILRSTLVEIIRAKFPRMSTRLVKEIHDVDELNRLVKELLRAESAAEATRLLSRKRGA